MGFGDFVKGVGSAVGNVAKGAAYVANPTHIDDIAEGVGKVGSYVAKNPGKTWDIGFEVGRAMAKDSLKPQNLAVTAGLLALTATGAGAPVAGAALAAKLGMGAKTAEVGLTALEGAKAGSTALKAVKTVDKVVDAAKTVDKVADAAKVVDKVSDAGRTLKRTERFAQDIRGTVQGVKEAKGVVAKTDKALGAIGDVKGASRELVGMQRYGKMATKRASWAESAVEKGWGKSVAGKIAGVNNSAADASKVYTNAARIKGRLNQVQGALEAPGAINKGVTTAADPAGAIEDRATQEFNARTHAASYTDRGMASTSMYGGNGNVAGADSATGYEDHGQSSGGYQPKMLGQAKPLTQPGTTTPGQAASPYNNLGSTGYTAPTVSFPSGGGTTPPSGPPGGGGGGGGGGTPPGGNTPGGTPSGRSRGAFQRGTTTTTTAQPTTQQQKSSSSQSGGGGGLQRRTDNTLSNKKQQFWEGTRRQAFAGIGAGYDWRPVEALNNNTYTKKKTEGGEEEQGAEDTRTTGKPAGTFQRPGGQQSGQQPPGSASFPKQTELGDEPTTFGKRMYGHVKEPQERVKSYGEMGYQKDDSDIIDAEVVSDSWDKKLAMPTKPLQAQPLAIGAGTPALRAGSRTAARRQGGIGAYGQSQINSGMTDTQPLNTAAAMMGSNTLGSSPNASFDFAQVGKGATTGTYKPPKGLGNGPS